MNTHYVIRGYYNNQLFVAGTYDSKGRAMAELARLRALSGIHYELIENTYKLVG